MEAALKFSEARLGSSAMNLSHLLWRFLLHGGLGTSYEFLRDEGLVVLVMEVGECVVTFFRIIYTTKTLV